LSKRENEIFGKLQNRGKISLEPHNYAYREIHKRGVWRVDQERKMENQRERQGKRMPDQYRRRGIEEEYENSVSTGISGVESGKDEFDQSRTSPKNHFEQRPKGVKKRSVRKNQKDGRQEERESRESRCQREGLTRKP